MAVEENRKNFYSLRYQFPLSWPSRFFSVVFRVKFRMKAFRFFPLRRWKISRLCPGRFRFSLAIFRLDNEKLQRNFFSGWWRKKKTQQQQLARSAHPANKLLTYWCKRERGKLFALIRHLLKQQLCRGLRDKFLTLLLFPIFSFLYSEKADLKPRHDSHGIGVPHMDSIYTTPTTGFHHPHHPNGIHHGSPEAMKVRMAAMVLSPPTRV